MVEPEEDNDASQDMNAMKRSQLALNKNLLEINDLRHLIIASRERQVRQLSDICWGAVSPYAGNIAITHSLLHLLPLPPRTL